MKEISITVTEILEREYLQACRIHSKRVYGILAACMLLFCGIFLLALRQFSAIAVAAPIVMYGLIVLVFELLMRKSYKNQLAHIPPVEYLFTSRYWQVRADNTTRRFEWRSTPKLKRTADCFFLYNDDVSSNLIPLRLLDPKQIQTIEHWFQQSRKASQNR